MSNKVSAVIVTAARGGYIRQCLDSVMAQACLPAEVIVIDNSCGKLAGCGIREAGTMKIIPGAADMSYCRSLNKGIKNSSGDLVLCLNDDVVLEKNFIAEAIKGFSAASRIGMVSGKVLRFDKQTLDSTGLFLTAFRSARERGYGKPDSGKFREGCVFGVSGAVAFYRRQMLEEAAADGEYFDEDFGFFYEDLDVAWRAENRGWRGYYVPAAIAYHLRGGTARASGNAGKGFGRRYLNDELYYCLVRNRYLAMIKNDSPAGFLLNLPCIIFYDLAAWLVIFFFRPRLIKKFFSGRAIFRRAFKKREALRK